MAALSVQRMSERYRCLFGTIELRGYIIIGKSVYCGGGVLSNRFLTACLRTFLTLYQGGHFEQVERNRAVVR